MPCLTRFSTATTTVFCILFDTTTPVLVRSFFLLLVSSVAAMALAPRLFTQEGFDAGDLAPHFFHFRGRFHTARGALKAKLVKLLAQLFLAGLKLALGLLTHLTRFHSP